jgi:hypothetical protein
MNSKIAEVFDEIDKRGISPEQETISGKPSSNFRKIRTNKAYNVAEIRKTYGRAYEKWTKSEDVELKVDYQNGLSASQIAVKHGRKRGAINSRLKKLGLEE